MSQKILGTMAGGAADCSFWLRHLAMQVREGGRGAESATSTTCGMARQGRRRGTCRGY